MTSSRKAPAKRRGRKPFCTPEQFQVLAGIKQRELARRAAEEASLKAPSDGKRRTGRRRVK